MKTQCTVGLFAVAILAITASSAQAVVLQAVLDGPSENPPNASPATGIAEVDINAAAHTMRVQANFSGLTGTTTAAHIHAAVDPPGNVGVATQTPSFTGFPLGVTSGTYDNTFDMTLASSYNASFVTANGGTAASAEAALFAALTAGRAYFNIHTTTFGGGEIRGFFAIVPEPSSSALAAIGLCVAARLARRRLANPKSQI